jgi:hypothetical protein
MTEWTDERDRLYRAEVERRFRERTPPAIDDIYSFDPAGRVTRSEMRTWSGDQFGVYAPEIDQEWVETHARWYRRMSKRVLKELGEDL